MKRSQSLVCFMLGLAFVVTQAMACTDGGDGGSGAGGGGGSSSSSGAGGGNEDCGMSFCGCWEVATMTFSATVQDAMTMMPLSGIELFCMGEDMPIATSDATGNLSFSIQTKESPGCGFERCNNLKLHDPTGMRTDLEGTYFSLNGKTIPM